MHERLTFFNTFLPLDNIFVTKTKNTTPFSIGSMFCWAEVEGWNRETLKIEASLRNGAT